MRRKYWWFEKKIDQQSKEHLIHYKPKTVYQDDTIFYERKIAILKHQVFKQECEKIGKMFNLNSELRWEKRLTIYIFDISREFGISYKEAYPLAIRKLDKVKKYAN